MSLDFTFDPVSLRFREASTGRFVKQTAIYEARDTVIDAAAGQMKSLGLAFGNKTINAAEFETRMMELIKTTHIASMVLARGGFEQMSAADYGFAGAQIKKQYEYLRGFVREAGTLTANQIQARAALYGEALRPTYWAMQNRTREQSGATRAKRMLTAADHCAGCVAEAARGFVPVADLAPIGTADCRVRCRCYVIYEKAEAA